VNFVTFSASADAEVGPLADQINEACRGTVIPPCFLAAIVKRETGGRNILQIGVPPGPGCGVGVCQITYAVRWDDTSRPTFSGASGREYDLQSVPDNLACAVVEFLTPLAGQMESLRSVSPTLYGQCAAGQILCGVAAGYNAGYAPVASAVANAQQVDSVTTGGNYASAVFQSYLDFCVASAKK
jgi:hypothetical protein